MPQVLSSFTSNRPSQYRSIASPFLPSELSTTMTDASRVQPPNRLSSAREARSITSIYIPPSTSRPDTHTQQSRFSPDTPSPPPHQRTESPPRRSFTSTFSRHTRERSRDQTHRASPPRSTKALGKQPTPNSSPEHIPSRLPFPSMSSARPASFHPNGNKTRSPASIGAGSTSTISTKGGNALGKLLLSVRAWGAKEPDIMIPIQPPQMLASDWPPLHVEKQCITCSCRDPKRRRKTIIRLVLHTLVLVFIVANIVVLNIRVFSSNSGPNNLQSPGWTGQLDADQSECLSQFILNAPATPSSYPCSSCLPLLSQVPPSFAMSSPADAQGVQDAVQFCGLKAIFESADQSGKATLNGTRWLNDVKFCAWGGVSCSSSGMVSSL